MAVDPYEHLLQTFKRFLEATEQSPSLVDSLANLLNIVAQHAESNTPYLELFMNAAGSLDQSFSENPTNHDSRTVSEKAEQFLTEMQSFDPLLAQLTLRLVTELLKIILQYKAQKIDEVLNLVSTGINLQQLVDIIED